MFCQAHDDSLSCSLVGLGGTRTRSCSTSLQTANSPSFHYYQQSLTQLSATFGSSYEEQQELWALGLDGHKMDYADPNYSTTMDLDHNNNGQGRRLGSVPSVQMSSWHRPSPNRLAANHKLRHKQNTQTEVYPLEHVNDDRYCNEYLRSSYIDNSQLAQYQPNLWTSQHRTLRKPAERPVAQVGYNQTRGTMSKSMYHSLNERCLPSAVLKGLQAQHQTNLTNNNQSLMLPKQRRFRIPLTNLTFRSASADKSMSKKAPVDFTEKQQLPINDQNRTYWTRQTDRLYHTPKLQSSNRGTNTHIGTHSVHGTPTSTNSNSNMYSTSTMNSTRSTSTVQGTSSRTYQNVRGTDQSCAPAFYPGLDAGAGLAPKYEALGAKGQHQMREGAERMSRRAVITWRRTHSEDRTPATHNNKALCAECGFGMNDSERRVSIQSVLYHRICFKCHKCDVPLSLKSYRKHPVTGDIVCEEHTAPEHVLTQPTDSAAMWTKRHNEQHDFFSMLERLQGNRLEDQRCSMPHIPSPSTAQANGSGTPVKQFDSLAEICARPGPYPSVVMPEQGGYWIDGVSSSVNVLDEEHLMPLDCTQSASNSTQRYKLEMDDTSRCYRRHFHGREHHNFYAFDDQIGPLILSVRTETISSQEHFRIVLRTRQGTAHEIVPASAFGDMPAASRMAKLLRDEISTDKFHPVAFPGGSDMLLTYDEHVLTNTYKVGLVYQKFGQTREDQLFGNANHSAAMQEFMDLLGERVMLRDFTGYRGGLDTTHGQTGDQSIYTRHKQREVMFHVSTLLPYTVGDPQQVQRKRHIGNDIVAIIFQDENTPFCPSMITSKFLHCFIVVQAINPCTDNTRYRVAVTARSDVPFFGPTLPSPAVFMKGQELRTFLLTKILNAENAAYKAERFARLAARTRCSLIDALHADMQKRNLTFYGQSLESVVPDNARNSQQGGLLDSFKKAIIGRSRSVSQDAHGAANQPAPSQTPSNWSCSSLKHPTSTQFNQNNTIGILPENNDHPPKNSDSGFGSTNGGGEVRSGGGGGSSSSSGPDTTPTVHSHKQPVTTADSESSSVDSLELEHDSDTGMESMSSAELNNSSNSKCVHSCAVSGSLALIQDSDDYRRLQTLNEQMDRLKTERGHLLRQNVTCKADIKKLKDRESSLSVDLQSANDEINRLKSLLQRRASHNQTQNGPSRQRPVLMQTSHDCHV